MTLLWHRRPPHHVNTRQSRGSRRPSPPSRRVSAGAANSGCLLAFLLAALAIGVAFFH